MTWFKVDDKAHANTKIRNVLATCPAALSLWTVAGSWVADELNDGFVPDTQLPWLMPAGAEELAQALVAARLWRRVRGGYQFHEWHKDGDGTKRNPTREEVLAERRKRAEAGQKGGLASGRARSKKQASTKANAEARAWPVVEPPSRPSPSKEGRGEERAPATRGAAHAPPEDPRVVAEAEEELRLKAEAAVAAIAEHQARTARGAAAARAAIPRRTRADPGPSALDRLTAAVANLPPLSQPPPDDDEPPPLAEVVPIKPTTEVADVPR